MIVAYIFGGAVVIFTLVCFFAFGGRNDDGEVSGWGTRRR
jgi:hypothetical protein